jgi:hypothetical protein
MTLTIELSTAEEALLREKAARFGMQPVEYLHQLINSEEPKVTTGARIRAVLGNRTPGTGTSTWSEVEAPCDPN